MIYKILKIQNCGRFKNYVPSNEKYGWNGVFEKINTIYAENGSGKTTFTQILKSATKNDCELMEKRKTLQSQDSICVEILLDDKKSVVFSSKKWKKNIPRIEVFDSFFSEDNMYVVSLGNYDNPGDFYDIVPNSDKIIEEINKWTRKRRNLAHNIRKTRRQ